MALTRMTEKDPFLDLLYDGSQFGDNAPTSTVNCFMLAGD